MCHVLCGVDFEILETKGENMRVFLIGLVLLIFSIVSLPLYLVAYLLGKKDPKKQVAFSQAIVKRVLKIMLIVAGVRLECRGVENVPKDEPIMYVSNHRSYVDILAGYCTVPTLTGFISKDTLRRFPCVSRWMKFLKCLFLDRDNPKEGLKTILTGISQIEQGFSIFIMPEGTRNHTDKLLPFHEGSFKLSTKTGCAIVPVAMKNTDKVLGNHFAWFHPMKVTVVYGEPIYPDQLEKEQKKFIGGHVQGIVQEMLEKME